MIMDTDDEKVYSSRRRDLPPISHLQKRGPRALPSLPRQDTADEMPVPMKKKKKKAKHVESTETPEVPKRDGGIEMGGFSSPRPSGSRERLTPEPSENVPQRKKKKKKAETVDQDCDQANLVLNGDMVDQNSEEETSRKPKTKKKTKCSKVTEMEPNNDLGIEDDDIITGTQPQIPQHALFSAPQGQSQPVAKVFVERGRRFQPAERTDRRRTSKQMEHNFMDVQPAWTTRDVSMRVHRGFRVIGLFSHGFLAGYAVWNIIVLYVLAGDQMSTLPNLLQQYYMLAYPAQCLFYFLLVLSTVSAFDRVNLARAPTVIRSFLTLDPVALASFLYFSALVLSLSQQMTSDRINLYRRVNASQWLPGSERSMLYPWIIVQLVVTLLVGLAWVLVSTSPDMDYTEESLMAMKVEHPSMEKKGSVTA